MKPSDLSEFFNLLGKAKKEKEEEFDNLLKEADINLDDLTSSLVSGIKEAKEDQKKQKKNEEKLIEQLDSIIDVIENPKEVKDITEPAVTVGVPEDFDVSKLEEEDALDVQDWNDGKDVKFTEVDAVDIIKPEPIKTPEISDTVAQAIKFIEETNIKEEIENSDDTNLDKLKTEIKQVRDILYKVLAHGPGSGEVNLLKLDDVDEDSAKVDGKVLQYDASSGKFVGATSSGGIGTESSVNTSGIITATKFVGDGSGLTGITASGSGVVVQDEGSNIGTAATINFIGSNVNAALSGGIANVTITSGVTTANVRTGILDVAGIATFRNDTLIGSGVTLSPDGDVFATGVTTSSSFVGDLTGDVTGTASNATQLNSQAASYYLDYDNFSNTPTIPSNNNQLTNGAGFITASDDITGNAATSTKLATARTIAGVSFDGSANISLNNNAITNGAGYITTSFTNTNQLTNGAGFITASDDITGNAATSTKLSTARTIAGVSFDGSANISLNNNAITNGAGYITGSSLNASNLSSGTIPDARFPSTLPAIDGSALTGIAVTDNIRTNTNATFLQNVNVSGTTTATTFIGNLTGNVTGNTSGSSGSCTGNAATATALANARTIAGVSFDGSANISLNNNAITNGAGYITATLTDEEVQDKVGAMFTGNTETGITATYQDADGTIDLVVGTLNQDTTGNAATATALETARNIGGVSFDGSANIDLPGVNSAGNQNTTGTSAGLTGTPSITVNAVNGATGTFSGNVTIGGVLTYEDVTNVDSIGVITARSGVLVGSGITLSPDGDVFSVGVTTFRDTIRFEGASGQRYINYFNFGRLQFNNNASAAFGNSSQGRVFSDGTHLKILNNASDVSGNIIIQAHSGEDSIIANQHGSIELYHNDSKKFETAETGAVVTGILTATSNVNVGSGITLSPDGDIFAVGVSTFTDNVTLPDNVELKLGSAGEVRLYHTGSVTNFIVSQHYFNMQANGYQLFSQNGSESIITAFQNGAVNLFYDNTKRFETTNTGITVTGTAVATSFTGDLTGDVTGSISGGTVAGSTGTFTTGVTTSLRSNKISLGDNERISVGLSSDLSIYHDSTQSIIADTGTGQLAIRGGVTVSISNPAGTQVMANFINGGAVNLFHAGVNRFKTTSTGAVVTGILTATSNVNVGSGVTLSPDGDIFAVGIATFSKTIRTNNGIIIGDDNKSILLGASDDMRIRHTGSHSEITDEGTGDLRLGSNRVVIGSPTFDETSARFIDDGAVELYYDNTKRFETSDSGVEITGDLETTSNVAVGSGVTLSPDGDVFTTGISTFTGTVGFGTHITLQDDAEIRLGEKVSGGNRVGDFVIRHDPNLFSDTYNVIESTNGNVFFVNKDTTKKYMYIRSNDIQLRDWSNNKEYIHCATNDFVKLNYNGSERLKTSNTGITVTGTAVATSFTGDLTGDVTGNADTATTLATARNIGGVSFNGSANIDLPGVNSSGNQDTTGNAATATALETARNIGGVSFDGSANIDLPGVNSAGNQNTSGTAAGLSGTPNISCGTIAGSTGTFTGDVDIADKIVHTGDTNTAIRFPAADTITAETGGSERLRIDSSGNLVIGHTASNGKLQVNNGDNSAVGDSTNPAFQIGGTTNYRLGVFTTNEQAIIANKNGDDGIAFHTKTGNGGSFGEAIRIESGGQLNIGGDYTQTTYKTQIEATDNNVLRLVNDSDDSNGVELVLYKDSASPADGDNIGGIYFQGNDDAGNSVFYANIEGLIEDASDGTEDGYIRFRTRKNGSIGERVRIQANGEVAMTSSGSITDALANLHVQNDTFRVSNNDDGADTTYVHIDAHTNATDGDRNIFRHVSNNVIMSQLTRQGQYFGQQSIYAGRTRTDENSPTNVYRHGANGFLAYSARTDDTSNYRTSLIMRAWDAGDVGDRNMFYFVDSQDDTTTADYDQHQRFGIKANGMTQSREDIWSGRCESDEGSPNSVFTSGNTNLVRSYATNTNAQSYMQGVAVPASNIYVFYAETGTSNDDDDIQFRVRSTDGRMQTDASSTQFNGADYAEYFEWEDGNPSNEDRVGTSVVLVGEKIRPATSSDDPSQIIGVISATPCVVGDSASLKYHDRYLKDDWGRDILEDVEMLVWNIGQNEHQPQQSDTFALAKADECCRVSDIESYLAEGRVPQWAVDQNLRRIDKVRKVNPNFDVNKKDTYEPREDRKEWDAVGLVGKLCMKKGQPTGTNWIKLSDKTASIERWLVR